MKQLLKEHEIKYIVRRRTRKDIDLFTRTFEFIPHGGYVEVRILGFFSSSSAQDFINSFFINPPVAIDAGFENNDAVNLIWQSQIDQKL